MDEVKAKYEGRWSMDEVKSQFRTMREYVEDVIGKEGPIPFSRYMELCLYGEAGSPPGFYTREREQFGKAGDFYTASDVHAVYGRLLARQFEQMWRRMGAPSEVAIVELGPGRGNFAGDVLSWVAKKYPEFGAALKYVMVEASASLRQKLREKLPDEIETRRVNLVETVEQAFADLPKQVIVFGNEFFDALPTEVLDQRGELRVGAEDGRFVEKFVTPSREVMEFVKKYAVQPEEGERVDAPLVAQSYMERIAELMRQKVGYCVFVDYGYVRHEMLGGRHMGTVTSFHRHTVCDSPYEAPGEQDITVHVNFTALASAARGAGLEPLAWVSQAQFLIGIGEESQFAEAFEGCSLPQEHAKRAMQLKHLITPEGMGEAFHVLVLARAVSGELDGLKFLRESNRI
jgi:SAM-dependent MidA family methyltransferase